VNARRREDARTRVLSPEEETAIRRALERRSGAQSKKTAPQSQQKAVGRAVESPRAARIVDNSGTSSPQAQPPADDAAVAEALARRREWTGPRQALIEPAKVQDPPANATGYRAEAPSGSKAVMVTPEEEGMLLARQAPGERENEDVIQEALARRGTPYVWGGASRGGFDCSGFVCYVFAKQRGLNLPHSASAQSRLGTAVRQEELRPGDLVFFTTYRAGVSHVGIYLGDGRFIHAANRRRGCRIDTLTTGYYRQRFVCARRLSPAPLKLSNDELKGLMQDPSELPPGR
jgi:cell wall-associated NlpC family hydrolase